MPYIKISDPNIIDLAAWQQVINVVNQHSDTLTAITNNFGAQGTGVVDFNEPDDFAIQYDPGSQKIVYGRTRVAVADALDVPDGTGFMYYGDIQFTDNTSGTISFGAKPVVTATYRSSSTIDDPPTTSNPNPVITVVATTENKFTYRIVNARSDEEGTIFPLTGFFYINWIAIGPK